MSLETPDQPGDASSIQCATSAQKRFVLVYARPYDGLWDRYGAVVPTLRDSIYHGSWFLQQEARRVVPGAQLKMRFDCEAGGQARVIRAADLPTSRFADDYFTIVDDLRAQGFSDPLVKYIVFYDAQFPDMSGQGSIDPDDSSGAGNANNTGGDYAIEYDGGRAPDWETLLHEASHTMGAVQLSAPNSSGAWHCTDSWDVMCADDGPPLRDVCNSGMRFDCNKNDFFNPAPPSGSYLATHWNLASENNSYVELQLPDTTPPSVPQNLHLAAAHTNSLDIAWNASSDNVAVAGYVVYRWIGSQWSVVGSTTSTSYTAGGLAADTGYSLRVVARDTSGNESAPSAPVSARTLAGRSPLYWLVRPSNGEHVLTINSNERQSLLNAGFYDYGVYGYVASLGAAGTTPLYRAWSAQWYDHLYGTVSNAGAPTWVQEGTVGAVYTAQPPQWSFPMYRVWCGPGRHVHQYGRQWSDVVNYQNQGCSYDGIVGWLSWSAE